MDSTFWLKKERRKKFCTTFEIVLLKMTEEGKKQKNASIIICHCHGSDPVPTEDTTLSEDDVVGGGEMIFHTTVTFCYCKYSATFCYMEVQHLSVKGKLQIVRTLCFIPKRKEMTSAFLSWIEKSPSSVNSIRRWLIIWTLSLFFTMYYFTQTTNSGQLYHTFFKYA